MGLQLPELVKEISDKVCMSSIRATGTGEKADCSDLRLFFLGRGFCFVCWSQILMESSTEPSASFKVLLPCQRFSFGGGRVKTQESL